MGTKREEDSRRAWDLTHTTAGYATAELQADQPANHLQGAGGGVVGAGEVHAGAPVWLPTSSPVLLAAAAACRPRRHTWLSGWLLVGRHS